MSENPEFNLRCCKALKLELVSDRIMPTYTIVWPGDEMRPEGIFDTWRVHKMKFHRCRNWCDLLVQECIKRNLSHQLHDELMNVSTFIFDAAVLDLANLALEVLEENS